MKSIASKLWMGMMALVVIMLILLLLFQIVFLNHFYTNLRISDIEDSGLEIIREQKKGEASNFQSRLDAFAYNNNLTAEMYDTNGHRVYITGESSQMTMMMNSAKRDVFHEALAGDTIRLEMKHPRFNSKYVLLGLPVGFSEAIEGVLLLTLPMAPVQETAEILKRQLFYISTILLTAAILISYLISRTFTKPIRDITKVSLEMAEGDLSARTTVKREDEIGKLAETINHMGKELLKLDELRKDLIANVSHELRTPLSLIKGYAETIRDVTGNNIHKREKQLAIIIEESDRISHIVEDILNLSQMQAGYMVLNRSEFEINEFLEKVLKKYEIMSEKTGISVNKEKIRKTIVLADENRIEQVLYNLINNAFNHTREGGTVAIRAVERLASIKIEVSDTGEGIPSEEIESIWDRFYKADKPEERQAGTGLGLTIVKNILEAHNLNYGVESQIGTGSTFWFELKKSKN